MKVRSYIFLFISLVTIFLLSSCSPLVISSQVTNDQWKTINSSSSIGQTFIANFAGLQEVRFFLAPIDTKSGTLTFHLRADPNSTTDIATVRLPIENITQTQYYRFNFPRLVNSNNQYYYAVLELVGEGSLEIAYGKADAYQNGAAYNNQIPEEAQLTFTLGYDPLSVLWGLFSEISRWVAYLLIGIILFVLPGWALFSCLWHGWGDLHLAEKFPLSIGVSLAIYAVVLLYTYLLNIQLGAWYVFIPLLISVFLIIYCNRYNLSKTLSTIRTSQYRNSVTPKDKFSYFPNIALLVTFLFLIISRYWAMRGLDIPLWNDSLHHTAITQLISDNHGLFSSWLPYAEYKTFSMHFGFPLAAALFSWVSRVSSQLSVLYIGQFLSIFAALALYPITVRLTNGNRFGGVIAVLVAGLLSPMPAYYINWGRYAQLAGQVILPVCMWMIWDVMEHTQRNQGLLKLNIFPWIKIIITAGTITGMLLAEFRMIFIIFTFMIAWLIGWGFSHWKTNNKPLLRGFLSMVFIGVISIVLFLPWGMRIQNSNLINYASYQVDMNTLRNLIVQDYKAWKSVFYYVPVGIVILGTLGWIWSLIRRDWKTVSFGIWIIGMASLYSLIILNIPWVHYVQSFAVIISLYIPVGILCGYFTVVIFTWSSKWRISWALILLIIIFLGAYGTWRQRDITKASTYALVTRPDIIAMDWIKENTQTNSRFLVEGTHINWVTNIVGTDAGWWIPLLANRDNTMPPQYAISNETPIEPGYSISLVNLIAKLEQTNLISKAGIKLLCDYGITHVYIGQEQGSVGNNGKPLFSPAELEKSAALRQIYHQDRVFIYAVEGACDN
jgi:hypothetical protein